jgi:hypothetical protein
MPFSNARNRVVVFRLSQEEYEGLKEACSERGARNLSEFTRSELLSLIRSESLDAGIQRRLSKVERRLAEVQGSVEEIVRVLVSPENIPARCRPGEEEK